MTAPAVPAALAFPEKDDAEWIVEEGARKLSPAHKKNVRFHLAMGTPILAGFHAWEWADGAGGACVAVLAVTREALPAEISVTALVAELPAGAATAYELLGGARFVGALRMLDADQVRAAVTRGLA